MGSLDPAKILMILVIALVVLGPERLPRVARQLGAAWHELTKIRDQVTEEVRSAIPSDMPKIPTINTGAISGFISGLTKPNATTSGVNGSRSDDLHLDEGIGDAVNEANSSGAADEDRGAPFASIPLDDAEFPLFDDPSMN